MAVNSFSEIVNELTANKKLIYWSFWPDKGCYKKDIFLLDRAKIVKAFLVGMGEITIDLGYFKKIA